MSHLRSDHPLSSATLPRDDFAADAEGIRPAGLSHYADIPAYGVLRHAAQRLPHRVAVAYRDARWTYEQLNHDAVRCAAMLQSLGVCPGDRVGLLLPNLPEYPIALNGIWRAGGIAVALSPLMVGREIEAMLRATDCRMVISLDLLSSLLPSKHAFDCQPLYVSISRYLPAVEQIGYAWIRRRRIGRWSMPGESERSSFWDAITRTRREWQPPTTDAARDAAYILPTGGTTGRAKAVTLSHQNLVANAWQQAAWTKGSFGEERMLAVLPFFHSYGLSAIAMGGAAMGATLLLHHRFQTAQVIRMIEQQRPTVFHAVPAMLVAINERLRSRTADVSSIKWVISGGASLDEAVAREFTAHSGATVVEGYGLSEASPVTHVGSLFHEPSYGTIGWPLPETSCRLVDVESGSVVSRAGDVGELWVRGPQVMLGYWNDAEATSRAIQNGWLRTGDLASRDSQGRYRIVGRHKDLIITSGFNVYPDEVEAVLNEAECVAEAAVVGHPDRRCGELVKAIVVLKKGYVWDEDALRAHCRERLSKHKVPRIYERSDGELPKNFLGKIIRRKLRAERLPSSELSADADMTADRMERTHVTA